MKFTIEKEKFTNIWCYEETILAVYSQYHPCHAKFYMYEKNGKLNKNSTEDAFDCGSKGYRSVDQSLSQETLVDPPLQFPQPNSTLMVTDHDYSLQHFWLANKEHKLIYLSIPKVACTTMLQLFYRAANISEWNSNNMVDIHYNKKNWKIYAKDQLSKSEFQSVMNDPEWTRAVMVREPKQRILSAYLDKYILHNNYSNKIRADGKFASFVEFVDSTQVDTQMILKKSEPKYSSAHHLQNVDPHHRPQLLFFQKFFPYMNFVADFKNAEKHIKDLLVKVGMWDSYGKSGWGKNGDKAIYQKDAMLVEQHSTNSEALYSLFYDRELEKKVEKSYEIDYIHFPDIWNKTKVLAQ
mmetsp:Transcript_14603/g.21717  ORF Transcript_14603/g.21717 Transcript_14603/m.21717 type:complete len:352 (-) Transcript_14603:33-1088(-)